jgi:hypothetical protein
MTDRAVDPLPPLLDRHIIDTDGGMVCEVDDVGGSGFSRDRTRCLPHRGSVKC